MDLNRVILIGRLTRDPEVKSLPSGQQVCSFGLATDRNFKDKAGQKQRQTEFHNITLFGRLSEIASQYAAKGALMMIEGRLRTRNWKDAGGSTHYRTEIIGENIQLGPKSAGKSSLSGDENAASSSASPSKGSFSEDIPIVEEEIDIKDVPF
jgi:single-strand DNA-binding protein